MGKRKAKHVLRGIIGHQPNPDSLATTDEERGLGLKRGTEFDFDKSVTADAYPINGGSERLSADFRRGRFMSSSANLFKFIGEPVKRHHQDRGRCQFFLHLEQVRQLQFTRSSN